MKAWRCKHQMTIYDVLAAIEHDQAECQRAAPKVRTVFGTSGAPWTEDRPSVEPKPGRPAPFPAKDPK